MITIPNVNKENSCLDCPVWSLCWDSKPTEDICKDRCPIVEPKHGRWRHYEGTLTCSVCHTEIYDDIMELLGDDVPRYCPNCGANMRGGA